MPKGQPLDVFRGPRAYAGLSDTDLAVDCREHDAVWVQVLVSGTSPLATLSLEGADQRGGNYRPLRVPGARHPYVFQSFAFVAAAPAPWLRVRLSDLSGTFGKGQGYTVIVTPTSLADADCWRSQGYLLRDGVTAADLLAQPAVPTLSSDDVGGSLSASTTYYIGVAPVILQPGSNAILGIGPVRVKSKATDVGHNGILIYDDAAVANADGYLIFCSTDAAPKLAGLYIGTWPPHTALIENDLTLTSVFGSWAAGYASRGHLIVGVVGTGLQTSHAIFAQNTAHVLDSLNTLDCRGYRKALLTVRAELSKSTVWSVAPSLTLLPWFKSQETSADWAKGTAITPTYLSAVSDSMTTYHEVDVEQASVFTASLAALAGLGSVDVWAELVP